MPKQQLYFSILEKQDFSDKNFRVNLDTHSNQRIRFSNTLKNMTKAGRDFAWGAQHGAMHFLLQTIPTGHDYSRAYLNGHGEGVLAMMRLLVDKNPLSQRKILLFKHYLRHLLILNKQEDWSEDILSTIKIDDPTVCDSAKFLAVTDFYSLNILTGFDVGEKIKSARGKRERSYDEGENSKCVNVKVWVQPDRKCKKKKAISVFDVVKGGVVPKAKRIKLTRKQKKARGLLKSLGLEHDKKPPGEPIGVRETSAGYIRGFEAGYSKGFAAGRLSQPVPPQNHFNFFSTHYQSIVNVKQEQAVGNLFTSIKPKPY